MNPVVGTHQFAKTIFVGPGPGVGTVAEGGARDEQVKLNSSP